MALRESAAIEDESTKLVTEERAEFESVTRGTRAHDDPVDPRPDEFLVGRVVVRTDVDLHELGTGQPPLDRVLQCRKRVGIGDELTVGIDRRTTVVYRELVEIRAGRRKAVDRGLGEVDEDRQPFAR